MGRKRIYKENERRDVFFRELKKVWKEFTLVCREEFNKTPVERLREHIQRDIAHYKNKAVQVKK